MPIIISPGIEFTNWNEISTNLKFGSTIFSDCDKKLAETDASEIAVNARIEKCLKITSWAKIIPAIGELKPAEIAAATPAPIIISWGMLGIKVLLLKNAPKVPPKCTRGP